MADQELFHAYVVGGARDSARTRISELLAPFELLRPGNPNYVVTEHAAFTIDDARTLRAWQTMASGAGEKKVFIVYTDFINHEAQNTLLKTLEEPVDGTHIIFAVPKPETLLPTLLSRVRILKPHLETEPPSELGGSVSKFLNMTIAERLSFVGKIAEKGDDDDAAAQVREKALSFIDALEKYLSEKMIETGGKSERIKLETILKLKRYAFTSGASVKMILETISLSV